MTGFLASKILTALVLPLGLCLLAATGAVLLLLVGRRRAGGLVLALATSGLWLGSAPAISEALVGALEASVPAEAPRPADAILVLGGVLRPPAQPRTHPDLGAAADRVLHAARLWRAGRAPRVIVSGGRMPWSPAGEGEATWMAELLVEWGVRADAILRESESRTTRENCLRSARLAREAGLETVLLVTSALHMRRALATCRTAGLDAWAAPTDFAVVRRPSAGLLDWLPDAEALQGTQRAAKELLGYEVYRLRGWIDEEAIARTGGASTPPADSAPPP